MNSTHISGSAAPGHRKGFSVRSGDGVTTADLAQSDQDGIGDLEDDGDEDGDEDEEDGDINIKSEDLIVFEFLCLLNSCLQFHPESMLRTWLKKRGKQHCIDFDDEELR